MAFLHITLYLKDSSAQCFPLWKQMTEFSVATAAHWLTHKLKLKTFYKKKNPSCSNSSLCSDSL